MITRYSQLVMPQDANVGGTLFGGQMVSWMDIAASKAAFRFLKGTEADVAVTRAIDSIEFTKPVHVGNWVNFESRIIICCLKILFPQPAQNTHSPIYQLRLIYLLIIHNY